MWWLVVERHILTMSVQGLNQWLFIAQWTPVDVLTWWSPCRFIVLIDVILISLEQGADLHMAQLMPLPLTVSCFSKVQVSRTEGREMSVCVCMFCLLILIILGDLVPTPFLILSVIGLFCYPSFILWISTNMDGGDSLYLFVTPTVILGIFLDQWYLLSLSLLLRSLTFTS